MQPLLRLRPPRPLAIAAVLSLASPTTYAVAPAIAVAAEATPDAAAAKRHFDTGLKLFKQRVFDAALLEFEQSYALGRRPSALKNAAQCHRELNHLADAYDAFELLIDRHGPQLKPAERKDVQRALAQLALATAALDVRVSETGADVAVDGKRVGVSPLPKKLRVGVGAHKLTATKAGFDPAEAAVSVVGQEEASVELKLAPEVATGHLRVRERSSGDVRVLIDDVDVGPAPWEGDLSPGSHTVQLRGPTLATSKQIVDITKRDRLDVVLEAQPTVGKLRITTMPPNAEILVDDKPVAGGLWEGELPVGPHVIEVRAPQHESTKRRIALMAGQLLSQDIALVAVPMAAAPTAASKEDGTGVLGPVRIGALVGVLALPRPVQVEIAGNYKKVVGLGFQYSTLPNIKFTDEGSYVWWSTIGTLRVFPFEGAFYVGLGAGYQKLELRGARFPIEASLDMSTPVIAPQFGWLWGKDSGFTVGLNFGLQIPLGADGDTVVTESPLPAGTPPLPRAEVDARVADVRRTVDDYKSYIGIARWPTVDLLKFGVFF